MQRDTTSGDNILTAVVVIFVAVILAVCAAAVLRAQARQASLPPRTLLSESGTGSKTTAKFTVGDEAWNLAFHYDCHGVTSDEPFRLTIGATFKTFNKLTGKTTIRSVKGGRSWVYRTSTPSGAGGGRVSSWPGEYYLEIVTACDWSVRADALGARTPADRLTEVLIPLGFLLLVCFIAWRNAQIFFLAIPWVYWMGTAFFGAAMAMQALIEPGGLEILATLSAIGMLGWTFGLGGVPPRGPKKRIASDSAA